jgi:hypothetical protein
MDDERFGAMLGRLLARRAADRSGIPDAATMTGRLQRRLDATAGGARPRASGRDAAARTGRMNAVRTLAATLLLVVASAAVWAVGVAAPDGPRIGASPQGPLASAGTGAQGSSTMPPSARASGAGASATSSTDPTPPTAAVSVWPDASPATTCDLARVSLPTSAGAATAGQATAAAPPGSSVPSGIASSGPPPFMADARVAWTEAGTPAPNSADPVVLWASVPGAAARPIARFDAIVPPVAVDPIAWTGDDAVIVTVHRLSMADATDELCGELWLVPTDGRPATRVTGGERGRVVRFATEVAGGVGYVSVAMGAAASSSVRYVSVRGEVTVGDDLCGSGAEPIDIAWAPVSEPTAAVACGTSVEIRRAGARVSRADDDAVALHWIDERTLRLATLEPTGGLGGLTIRDMDVVAGTARRVRAFDDEDIAWAPGFAVSAFTGDGQLLLAHGGPRGAPAGGDPDWTAYVLDVTAGSIVEIGEAAVGGRWSPDGRTVVSGQGTAGALELLATNADGSGRRTLARLPAAAVVWAVP